MTPTDLAFVASRNGGLPDWIPIGISLLALIGTLGNYLLTLSRGRKRLHIASDVGHNTYWCRVTNTGYIGLQVEFVHIPQPGVLLRLPDGDTPRKLDQGESQVWEVELEYLLRSLRDADLEDLETPIVAIARDTTGKEYIQSKRAAFLATSMLSAAARLRENESA